MYRKYKKPWSIRVDENTDMHRLILFLEMCGYNMTHTVTKSRAVTRQCGVISYKWDIVKPTFGIEYLVFKDVDDLIKRHMKLSEKDGKKNEEV